MLVSVPCDVYTAKISLCFNQSDQSSLDILWIAKDSRVSPAGHRFNWCLMENP